MEREILLSQGQMQIPCKITQPDDHPAVQVVLGVHGLGGSADDAIQVGIAEEMALFYDAVIRFDLPGHGSNPENTLSLENCRQTLLAVARYAKEAYPETDDLCIFATGFGAYVTLTVLEELLALPGQVRLVVQTPSVRMHNTLLSMVRRSRQTLRAMDKITLPTKRPLTITYSFYQELEENTVLVPQPIPMLILHGEADDYIPRADIQNFRRINEGSKLVYIPGASHQFMEEGAWDMVLDLTRDWFAFQQVLLCDWR